jgi:hypothetical protein
MIHMVKKDTNSQGGFTMLRIFRRLLSRNHAVEVPSKTYVTHRAYKRAITYSRYARKNASYYKALMVLCKDFTNEEVACALGVSDASVGYWVKLRHVPTPNNQRKIFEVAEGLSHGM